MVSDEQRHRVTSRTHLSLVFRLEPQPSLDAAPRLQKGLALSPVGQVTDEDPRGVHTHEQHSLSCYLKHTHTHRQVKLNYQQEHVDIVTSKAELGVLVLNHLCWETSRKPAELNMKRTGRPSASRPHGSLPQDVQTHLHKAQHPAAVLT